MLLYIIDVSHCCACPNLTVYYICTVGSMCIIRSDGFIQVPSVFFAMSHSSLGITTFSWMSKPCVILISPGDDVFMTIVALPSDFQRHDIRYQKHFFKLRLPPVLNNFLLKFWEIPSIAAVIWRTGCWFPGNPMSSSKMCSRHMHRRFGISYFRWKMSPQSKYI